MSLMFLMSPKPRPLVLIISKKTRDIRDKRDVSTPPPPLHSSLSFNSGSWLKIKSASYTLRITVLDSLP